MNIIPTPVSPTEVGHHRLARDILTTLGLREASYDKVARVAAEVPVLADDDQH